MASWSESIKALELSKKAPLKKGASEGPRRTDRPGSTCDFVDLVARAAPVIGRATRLSNVSNHGLTDLFSRFEGVNVSMAMSD